MNFHDLNNNTAKTMIEIKTETETNTENATKTHTITDSIPKEIYNKLFPHQKSGIPWLYNTVHKGRYKGGILADDMGCGKSALVSAYLLGLFKSSKQMRKVLIVSPNSICDNWRIELRTWAPGVTVYDCTSKIAPQQRLTHISKCFEDGGICVTNYENVAGTHFLDYMYKSGKIADVKNEENTFNSEDNLVWDYLILDEAHQIRNVNQRSKRVKKLSATHRLAMTGTPIQNRMMDYYNVLDWVTHSNMFSTKKEFIDKYGKPIEAAREKGEKSDRKYQSDIRKGRKAAIKLKSLVEPIKLQRSKFELNLMKDVKKTDVVVHCYMSAYQQELYNKVLSDETLGNILDEGSKKCMLTYLTHLKSICDSPMLSKLAYQIDDCSSPKAMKTENLENISTSIVNQSNNYKSRINDSGKLEFITHLLRLQDQENQQNPSAASKTLIFSRSKKILSIIQEYLEMELGFTKNTNFMRLDGDVKPAHRQNIINGFNHLESVKVMLLTTQVGREGLTLTSANRVVIFDPAWNPSEDAQAVDRAYRIGQKRHVVVYRLITCGTVEEKMYRRQIHKSGIIKTSTDKMDHDSRRYFSSTDLTDLFEVDDFRKSETCDKLIELHGGLDSEDGKESWLIDHLQKVKHLKGDNGEELVYGLNFVNRMYTVKNDDVEEMLEGDIGDELIKDEVMKNQELQTTTENVEPNFIQSGFQNLQTTKINQLKRPITDIIDLTQDDDEPTFSNQQFNQKISNLPIKQQEQIFFKQQNSSALMNQYAQPIFTDYSQPTFIQTQQQLFQQPLYQNNSNQTSFLPSTQPYLPQPTQNAFDNSISTPTFTQQNTNSTSSPFIDYSQPEEKTLASLVDFLLESTNFTDQNSETSKTTQSQSNTYLEDICKDLGIDSFNLS